ncbi:MAG: hypothetical protein R2844_02400 [Caldilineales bacterium]
MTITPSPMIVRVLEMLAGTRPVELGCEEVTALLDEYCDAQAAGEDMSRFNPVIHAHLRVCVDCREEYEALLAMISMNADPPGA